MSKTQPNAAPQKTVQTVQIGKDKMDRLPWIEIAEDGEGRFHWCLWAANGRPVCMSAVIYEREKDCVTAAKSLAKHVAGVKDICRASSEAK